MRVGVLAVQGNVREHAAMLRRLGADVVEVRKPEQLAGLDGLVVPGGESTTFMRLMRLYGLDEALRTFAAPVFGTCAGMIVLDRAHLDLMDLEVDRNTRAKIHGADGRGETWEFHAKLIPVERNVRELKGSFSAGQQGLPNL